MRQTMTTTSNAMQAGTTQAEKFTVAQAAVKTFMVKHGNVVFFPDTKKASKLKEKFYALQEAASDAYWTDEMDAAIKAAQQ